MTEGHPKMLESDTFELIVDPKDAVIIQRLFKGKTERDLKIENFVIPTNPVWLRMVIKMIRFYQRRFSRRLGNRCVFDPSCSHYSELAYRKKGLVQGTILTISRLYRCRPKNGGIDDIQ